MEWATVNTVLYTAQNTLEEKQMFRMWYHVIILEYLIEQERAVSALLAETTRSSGRGLIP